MNQEIQEALNKIQREMTMGPLSQAELAELDRAFAWFLLQIKQAQSLKVA